jgi:hypothetical protein
MFCFYSFSLRVPRCHNDLDKTPRRSGLYEATQLHRNGVDKKAQLHLCEVFYKPNSVSLATFTQSMRVGCQGVFIYLFFAWLLS